MAPVSDSVYFPPLGECLTGERVLLSWKHVATALSDASGQRQRSSALVEFLSDAYVQSFLENPAGVFTKTVNTAQSDFDTKTAPINVTVESNDEFDIKIIKEDTQWLSKNANINLVAALRIVMVDFQSRASRHLCGPLSTQDATNLQEAAGLKNGQGSSFLADLGAAAALDAEEIWTDFEKPETRRRRIFETYLSERRNCLMAIDYCISIRAYGYLPIYASTTTDLAKLYNLKTSLKAGEELSTLLSAHLQPLGDTLDLVESGFTSVTDDPILSNDETEFNWLATILAETVHSMSIVLQLADKYGDKFPPSNILSHWFGLMARVTFFEHIQPLTEPIGQLILPLQTLAVAASILLLKPTQALAYIAAREEDPSAVEDLTDVYFLSHEVLEHIHKPVDQAYDCNSQAATPVIWVWSLILRHMNISLQGRAEKRDSLMWQNSRDALDKQPQLPAQRAIGVRRNSAGSVFSIESSKYDAFLEGVGGKKDLELAEQLAQHATADGKVFEVISSMVSSLGSTSRNSVSPLIGARIRATFLQVLKESYPYIGYRGETLSALLSVLSAGSDYWDISAQQRIPKAEDALAGMLRDEHMLNFYFEQALTRYPYELMPFISLCRHLCDASGLADDDEGDLILDLLRRTPTLTLDLPTDISYEIVHEDEAVIQFRLEDEVPLIGVSSSWKRRYSEDDAYLIPAGTLGRFMADTGRVVQLEFAHSTIAFLGRRLEINLNSEGYECLVGMLQPEEVAEIISLLAALIRVDHLRASQVAPSNALVPAENDILHEASKHISGGKDIVTVVCDTMDYLLQNDAAIGDESAIIILNACMHFLDAILPAQPSRVWSYLARSELLNSDSRAGQLAKITGTLDLISSRFDLLDSAVRLFSRLIDTATASAVHRRIGSKASGRQKIEANPWLGTADKVLSKVSHSIAQASVDIFENTSTWRFESEERRILLLNGVVPILEKLIRSCCCMGDSSKPDNLAYALRPAALYVVECFVEPSTGTLRFQPILSSLITAFTLPPSTLYPAQYQILRNEVISVIELSTAVLRVSDTLEQSSAIFETYLFKSCTLLARICAASDHFKTPTLWLLDALVVNGGKLKSEPPSLLGYLGPQISKSFLQLLSGLGKPFALHSEVKTTWKFFTSILRNRQQWMSNCLLTGQTPREAMKREGKKNEMSKDSIFASALGKLGTLKSLDTSQALVVLDFVTAAQNYWPWTVFTLQKDTTYIDGLREYVRELKPWHLTAKTNTTQAAKEARVAAYIAEIFSMQLYHSRHLGKADALAKTLSADLDYYLRDGVEVAGYNKSLHNNFAKNFANKYTGCTLEDFKRSSFEPRALGVNYFYDLDRADAMLSFDPGWYGRKSDGFKTEMELANANLSLVDAQISLFHAWEYLLVELSNCLPSSETIAKQMIQVAQQCLDANQDLTGPESIFKKLVDSRADLALVIIQRLAKSGLVLSDVNQLLATVVGTINAVEDPFSSETAAYYRTLLKTLFVTLRAYQTGADNASIEDVAGSAVSVAQTVLNVLDRVVGRGFRALVSLIHDKDAQIVPEDLAILTAILQACLSLPSIEQSQSQISNIMASHDCVHAATSLFSWADKLTDRADPVYGELSILFVLELSTLPLLAEQLACDGILSSLLSANLTKYMLKSQLSPYAEAPVAQRCYSIWVKGFLPLMLNLLTALGPTVAPEIAYVLNEFSHLLHLSVDRFEAPGTSRTQSRVPHYITLLATSEIHALALLTKIINSLRVNNTRDIAEVEYDSDSLLENIEFWLSSNKLLKERLMPLGQREVDWRGMKSASGRGDNLLEDKVLGQLESVRDVLSEELDVD